MKPKTIAEIKANLETAAYVEVVAACSFSQISVLDARDYIHAARNRPDGPPTGSTTSNSGTGQFMGDCHFRMDTTFRD